MRRASFTVARLLGPLTFWKGVFCVILAVGLYATVVRFAQGLGAATNLSDAFPWGLWIGFDLLVGVGLAAGGFVVAATVHIFRIHKYEAIARPAVLTAFLGYLLVIVALLFDLGKPWNIWHPIIMWNPHSVMFEVGWCVMLYTTVLALEFSPMVFERLGWKAPLRWLSRIFVPVVIAGVLLSTMHQSSLGTLYVIAEGKLHGLWYTPLLPVFFFISAVAGGLAMTIVESYLSFRAFGKRLEADLLRGMARVIVVVLAVFVVWKFQDLAMRGNFALMFDITPESVMFWGEMALGALLPMVLFAIPRVRHSQAGLFFAALLTVLGFIIGRLNVAITGMTASSGVTYVPSWMEFAVSIMIVAIGLALFGLAAKHLAVFPESERPGTPLALAELARQRRRPVMTRTMLVFFWGFLLIGVALWFWATDHSGTFAASAPHEPPVAAGFVAEADELDVPDGYTFPQSEESPGPVTFNHETHAYFDGATCATCHSRGWSLQRAGSPLVGAPSYERIHEGDLCASCHDGSQAFAIDDDCSFCHQ